MPENFAGNLPPNGLVYRFPLRLPTKKNQKRRKKWERYYIVFKSDEKLYEIQNLLVNQKLTYEKK